MMTTPPQGPFCQSCGMPLSKPVDFGTAASGIRVNDYCSFCFRDGRFTEPDLTPQAMIDHCVTVMASEGIMPEPQARRLMAEMIPQLKRWRKPVTA
jgi:hypothetical protein